MADRNIRDYGLPEVTANVIGPPTLGEKLEIECPNCKGKTVFSISVQMAKTPLMRGTNQVGTYLGCAACPWASPMGIVTVAG